MKLLVTVLCLSALAYPLCGRDLVFVGGEAYPPLCYSENGSVVGIEIDLMNELARRTGIVVRSQALPWARAQSEVASGEADAFITIVTADRERFAVMSPDVWFDIHLVAVTAKDNPRLTVLRSIRTVEDTLPFPQVNYVGTSLADSLLARAEVTYLNSADAIFQFLLLHRADLFLDTDVVLSYNAARQGVAGRLEILPPVFEDTPFRLWISKKSPFAAEMPRFNRAIQAMRDDGTIASIFAKYTKPAS